MILCCGEALIDMIPSATDSGKDGFVPHSGGAVFNTAVALGRLGTDVGMLSGLSRDMFGQQLVSDLQASRVDTRHVVLSDRPTTLAFVQLQDGHASYSFYDENSAGRLLSAEDLPRVEDAVSALYFGGISLACEPGAEAYAALLDRDGKGRAVMLDPNIRPGFVQDRTRYLARLDRMIKQSDIVKVSHEDLDWMDDRPLPWEDKARALLDKGPALVILTRGADGAQAFLRSGEAVRVPARPVPVVDTVGAGDTFNAGVLAKLSRLGWLEKGRVHAPPRDVLTRALEFGARVAAVTVARAGANPPWMDEL